MMAQPQWAKFGVMSLKIVIAPSLAWSVENCLIWHAPGAKNNKKETLLEVVKEMLPNVSYG
jgi:hypothetical protein